MLGEGEQGTRRHRTASCRGSGIPVSVILALDISPSAVGLACGIYPQGEIFPLRTVLRRRRTSVVSHVVRHGKHAPLHVDGGVEGGRRPRRNGGGLGKRARDDAAVEEIYQIVREYNIHGIVAGWPLSLDGSVSRNCHGVLRFLDHCSSYLFQSGDHKKMDDNEIDRILNENRPVTLWDERYSTVEAYDETVNAMTAPIFAQSQRGQNDKLGGTGRRRRTQGAKFRASQKFRESGMEDAVAASVILRDFFNANLNTNY